MTSIKLSKRLKTIADKVDKNSVIADIGCDHGYLASLALQKGIKFVQLIDNKEMCNCWFCTRLTVTKTIIFTKIHDKTSFEGVRF